MAAWGVAGAAFEKPPKAIKGAFEVTPLLVDTKLDRYIIFAAAEPRLFEVCIGVVNASLTNVFEVVRTLVIVAPSLARFTIPLL